MTQRDLPALQQLVSRFISRQVSFWDFHRDFIATYVRLPEGTFRSRQADWARAYELVLASTPAGEDELRLSLRSTLGDMA